MGYGIYFRHARCKAAWKPHLENSAKFIRDAACAAPNCKTLLVLGAGRLLDLDTKWAAKRFDKIILVDADPSLSSTWRKHFSRSQLESYNLDITGSLDDWSEVLNKNLGGLADLRAYKPKFNIPNGALVVSLNLLSQLPIYWRDRVLAKFKDFDHNLLEAHAAELQEKHLLWLGNSEACAVIVISDIEFEYYKTGTDSVQKEPALYGYSAKLLDKISERHDLLAKDSWYWDLAPEGIEQVGYGERHKVVARFFIKK